MGSEDADLMEEGGGGGGGGGISFGGSSVSCTICFESVIDDGDRSLAKLQCGHQFHLDCIGSAFNAKGAMQCPNCRKIEKGRWRFGSHKCPSESSMDELMNEEDFLYDLTYSHMQFGVHWCPFRRLSQVHPSFEEGESASTMYHELLGHHAIFAQHAAASLAAHACPYIAAYLQSLQPSSLYSSEADVPSLSYNWHGIAGSSDVSTSNTMDLHRHTWEHPPSSLYPTSNGFGVPDQASVSYGTQRSSRGDSDGQSRWGPFVPPVVPSHGSGARSGSLTDSTVVPPYPGSNSRSRDRASGTHSYHHQQQPLVYSSLFPNVRRSDVAHQQQQPITGSFPVPNVRRTNAHHQQQPITSSSLFPNVRRNSAHQQQQPITSSTLFPHVRRANAQQHPMSSTLFPNVRRTNAQQQQQPIPSSSIFPRVRRTNARLAPILPAASSSENTSGLYMFPPGSSSRGIQEVDNSVHNHLHTWEQDRFAAYPMDGDQSWWGSFHQAAGGSDSGR